MTPGKDQHYQDTVVRLIRLSELTGDAQGVDEYYDAALKSGTLRAEVIYLYSKWTARRINMPAEERLARADAGFAALQPNQSYFPQATYYRGALKVEQKKYDEAIAFFETVVKLPVPKKDPKLRHLQDLASLAVARVLVEQGKLAEAVERYRAFPSDSEEYVEALFERADTLVRMGNLEEALRTSEILIVIAKDTSVAPDAQILHANLLLKLGASNHEEYEKASLAFGNVVQTYKPVRDQVKAIIDLPEPVKYFEELLGREPNTDVTRMLPRAAQGFVDPSSEVKTATNIRRDLSASGKDVKDSDELAKKLLEILSRGGLDMFPQLREANGRAVQMSNTLVRLESNLVRLQVKLLGDDVPPAVKAEFERLKQERDRLDALFQQLPKNQDEYDLRLQKFRAVISKLEKKSFQVRQDIDQLNATLNGDEKYWRDTVATKHADPALVKEQENDFKQHKMVLEQLDALHLRINKQLSDEKLNLFAQANGGKEEEALRAQYHQQLTEMQQLISRALPQVRADNRPLLDRLSKARDEIDRQQSLLSALRLQLRTKADERANSYRQKVLTEQSKLTGYHGGLDGFGTQTGQMLGQIAVNAFERVARQFNDIVLKGDVGVIDVAWARKQEHTDKIMKSGKEKEDALKLLQDRFKEVLNDAD
jgi:tetratricopeptide (TPR) repeat protein